MSFAVMVACHYKKLIAVRKTLDDIGKDAYAAAGSNTGQVIVRKYQDPLAPCHAVE
jgi:hypothetical protein